MDYLARFWNDPEEENATHLEHLLLELMALVGASETVPADGWAQSEESLHLARRVAQMSEGIVKFVDSGFTHPPEKLELHLAAIHDLRIRKVVEEDPAGMLRGALALVLDVPVADVTPRAGTPHVELDIDAMELLRLFVRLRLGYQRRHWSVDRLIEIAARGLTAASERGMAFLARLVNCHVLGLDDEVVIWAGSTLDAELDGRLEGEDGASHASVMSRRASDAVRRIREAADATRLVVPGLAAVDEILEDLRDVLLALRTV